MFQSRKKTNQKIPVIIESNQTIQTWTEVQDIIFEEELDGAGKKTETPTTISKLVLRFG